MNVSHDLGWWSYLLDNDRLRGEDIGYLVGKLDDVLSLARELTSGLDVLALLRLQEGFDEHLAKCVIRVFINLCMVLLLWIQLLWFFCELVYRDLSHYQ